MGALAQEGYRPGLLAPEGRFWVLGGCLVSRRVSGKIRAPPCPALPLETKILSPFSLTQATPWASGVPAWQADGRSLGGLSLLGTGFYPRRAANLLSG